MLSLKELVVLVSCVLHQGNGITNKKAKAYYNQNDGNSESLNFIWNLTSYAVQSRQSANYPIIPLENGQNILNALFSIAQNDDHLCVPKLLCEITSGTISYGRQSLPMGLNMDSFLGILSSFEAVSPIILFGRAALLGYNSRGDPYNCLRAYPKCPKNPDLLLNYLNNHNGGFFRFFNGIPNQQSLNNPEIVGFDGQHYGFVSKKQQYVAQKRILNEDKKGGGYFRFPFEDKGFYRNGRKLVFPSHGSDDNSLDIQKPLPNHVPSPTIFPVRTGTGSLVIEDFDEDEFYHRNKMFVKFV